MTLNNQVKIFMLFVGVVLTGCGGEGAAVPLTDVAPIASVPTILTTPAPTPSVTPSASPSPAPSASPTPYVNSGGGTGIQANPYLLMTPDDVQHISDHPAAYFEMGRDIDMSGYAFKSLGSFSGTLYGQTHALVNLTITETTTASTALFGAMSGTVVQLRLTNFRSSGLGFASGFAVNVTGLLSACEVYGTITSPSSGNGYNTGVGNPVYVTKGAGANITLSTTKLNVQFNGNTVNTSDRM